MKLKIFFLLLIVAVMSITPMIYTGKFTPSTFFESVLNGDVIDFKKLKIVMPEQIENITNNEKVQVYQWRNEQGVMQFSSTPPTDARPVKRIILNTNDNVIDAIKVPSKDKPPENQSAAMKKTPSPYSIKGMKKVMQNAKGVEEVLKKRNEEQLKLMGER